MQSLDFYVLFCHSDLVHDTSMATLAQKIRCEQSAREMIRREGLPEPDVVEYGYTCIRLIWAESRVVLVVEIDKPPRGFEPVGEYLDDPEVNGADEEGADID